MDKIGPYQILEVLHRGPQPLYKVKAADGRVLAVKALPVAGLTDEARERFMREAETCRLLNHPNLTHVYEIGEADGMLYQAMDLLEGADLGKVIAEGRHFSWNEKLSIMEQVCDGLQYAHDKRLVHRDIKPANLFLENSGHVRVLDFGMVRVAESQLTKAGSALGTLNYMSPEQIHGEPCTAASDVFSAGIVFFQLASGRHPFSARERSLGQVVSAIVFEAPPKLNQLCPDAPEGLEFLLDRALEKDASKRLQNGGDLKQGISLCRATLAMGGRTPAGPPAVPADPKKQGMPVTEGEKTKVMARSTAEPVDAEKTKVMRRQGPEVVPKGAAPAQPAPDAGNKIASATVKPRPPGPATLMGIRFCPICTAENAAASTVCKKCGNPLSGSGITAAKSSQWPLYAAIGVAVLLAVALVLVLVLKR